MESSHIESICESIVILRSQSSGREFPAAELTGDTDMVTAGWISLSSSGDSIVVLVRLTSSENQAKAAGLLLAEERINKCLGRRDLRCPWLVRAEPNSQGKAGQTFMDFKAQYRPPTLYFRDITSENGTAIEIGRLSVKEFEQQGGTILTM